MEELTRTMVDLKGVYRLINGPVQSKLLLAGISLEIFNYLEDPILARNVAKTIDSHPENTQRFLDGLVAAGLLIKKAGRYQNTDTAQAVLVKGRAAYLGELVSLMIQDPPTQQLVDLVRQGPPEPSRENDMGSEETWNRYACSMANYQRAGLAGQAVDIVSTLPEFEGFEKMLDLGGGPGLVGIALTGAHPKMKGVIFDRPGVVKVAEKFIRAYKMENRVSVMGGNYMQEAIGDGYDLVWASATLNFAGPDLDIPIQKVHQALKPGGVFVSLADGLREERTWPAQFVMSNLCGSLMGQDIGIDQGMIAQAMTRAGFARVVSRTVDTAMMPMDIDIGWK